jgi:Mg2+/Co2+ transporter CorB
MFWIIGAIFFLLVLSAFFSGSETALTAASRPLMHKLARDGNKRAKMVNRLREEKDRLIGAILLGNNLVNILASALATSLLIAIYGEAGVFYATVAMTFLILIFAEVLPKTYAFRDANRTSLIVVPLVNFLVVILSPITRSIQIIVRGLFVIFGIRSGAPSASSEEELRGAIDLHATDQDNGANDSAQHERAMLKSVLDLSDVPVEKIMTHRKDMVEIDSSLPPRDIIAQIIASPYTRIPLWKDQPDNIVGVLHAKALLKVTSSRDDELDALDILSLATPPWFIPESTTLFDQLHAFRQRKEHSALIVDEYGSLMGLVTLEDILEEIVGDISDEHDIAEVEARICLDGSYVVDGAATIRDLNRQFEWRLPDEETSTLAGLILHESRRIPDVGQAFMFHKFRFEILERRRHQITSIRITPPGPETID